MKEKSAYEERQDVVAYLRSIADQLAPDGDPKLIVRLLADRLLACDHLLVPEAELARRVGKERCPDDEA